MAKLKVKPKQLLELGFPMFPIDIFQLHINLHF